MLSRKLHKYCIPADGRVASPPHDEGVVRKGEETVARDILVTIQSGGLTPREILAKAGGANSPRKR